MSEHTARGQDSTRNAAGPTEVREHVVALDYGQFYLDTGLVPGGDVDDPIAQLQNPPQYDDVGNLLEDALDGPGIAQGNHTVVVCSPHQNNFEMALRVETWADEPPTDLRDWDEVSETVVDVGHDGLLYSSPTLDGTSLHVPPGRHRLRISGRGFVNRGWPGSTTPGDDWRLQLWPTSNLDQPVRLKTWQQPDHA